mmetsp:Transcript_16477/g.45653  ORF Transcript_16477/g.45653 Transcript_16477/m.45653 type:complete len:341 (-) Transcript_16477:45-1067(-)|eukprot:CAMPEP_0177396564 /NCGR_PEP_ID=MMETSP0368-20130122/56803_1 /TAXON_ID=447022 ORGANISM="Scrippsiella hangoei-like, Strain SHHI-4" /NCGR_SAMPLE_ID=MMETSP0368 /ASSEMBLY_ACC=CAM_ASM_000363 /LENGTH=340 /DNA_ID=CAMNT_0018863325 /DNA_START=32 /DNA_END=1054 /DNA_ORIENTATION=-
MADVPFKEDGAHPHPNIVEAEGTTALAPSAPRHLRSDSGVPRSQSVPGEVFQTPEGALQQRPGTFPLGGAASGAGAGGASLAAGQRWVSFGTSFSARLERERWLQRLVGTCLPVMYVWMLPLLAEGGWAYKCDQYPRCEYTGSSVSSYISNPQATGAMAGCFFYPCMHMWMNAKEVSDDKFVYRSLILFQEMLRRRPRSRQCSSPEFAFGLFLSAPVIEFGQMHGLSVATFSAASLTHFCAMMRHCHSRRLWKCKVLLVISSMSFLTVFALVWISRADHHFLKDRCPFLFYVAEALGLSSQAIFPMLWFRDHTANPARSALVTSSWQREACRRPEVSDSA